MTERQVSRAANGQFAAHENVRDLVLLPDEWIFEHLWRRILSHANGSVSVTIAGRRRQRMTRFAARVLELAHGTARRPRALLRYIELVRLAAATVTEIDTHNQEAAVQEAQSIEMAAALESGDEDRWRAALQRFIDRNSLSRLGEDELIEALGTVREALANPTGS
jgi:hypothetical protein